MNKKIPRVINRGSDPPDARLQPRGYGMRYGQPLAPVGEAARRDPRIPDAIPGLERPPQSQANASPRVQPNGAGWRVDGGSAYDGLPPRVLYVKPIGTLVTRSLARPMLAAQVETIWRVGGVSMPPDFGYGIGAGAAADAIWPNNPQVYLRNPGIRPMLNAPQTFRYAPGMGIQPLGPSIADLSQRWPTSIVSS